jgi:hypothetical protein
MMALSKFGVYLNPFFPFNLYPFPPFLTLMSLFFPILKLRLLYLIYSFVTFFCYSMILHGVFLNIANRYAYAILGVVGIVALYLQTQGIDEVRDHYHHNKIGKGRAARVLYRHRDVMQIDTSWVSQWNSSRKHSLFSQVIPANLIGLVVLWGLFTFLARPSDLLFYGLAVGFLLLAGLSRSYADNHLNSPEIGELYERPQTFDSAFTNAKQEIVERASMQQAKEQIEKERRRNMPLPPESDKQRRPPRKPY